MLRDKKWKKRGSARCIVTRYNRDGTEKETKKYCKKEKLVMSEEATDHSNKVKHQRKPKVSKYKRRKKTGYKRRNYITPYVRNKTMDYPAIETYLIKKERDIREIELCKNTYVTGKE